jgi:serine/threonine protein kinase
VLDNDQSRDGGVGESHVFGQDHFEVEGYRIGRLIGQGAQGWVYEAVNLETNEAVAVKICKRTTPPREVELAGGLDHAHILKIFDCQRIIRSRETLFAIVMPLSTFGALRHSNAPELTVMLAIQLLHEIGSALAYIHSLNIVHHDIKPANILIFENGFSLSDFSVSVILDGSNEQISDQIGTSTFMAPEISTRLYFPKPTDMWSLGVTVYCLLFGMFPFDLENCFDRDDRPAAVRVADHVMPFPLNFPKEPVVPLELMDVLSGLLEKDPLKRTTAEELVRNEWIGERIEEWSDLMTTLRNRSS